jgi:Sulfotransferase family
VQNTYLFILCPPYSGSTILWKLVATSDAVSSLPNEGQFLPEVQAEMRERPWDETRVLPWGRIKSVWDGYWNHDKPILLEKSPPNLIRTDAILAHFDPVRFLLMVRDPYAHCEGLMRRNGWDAARAAQFSVRCLRQQARNAATLPDALAFTYEALADDPQAIARRIEAFLPALGMLKAADSFHADSIDGFVDRRIVNLNERKIEQLSPQVLDEIDGVLSQHVDVLRHWGYALRG